MITITTIIQIIIIVIEMKYERPFEFKVSGELVVVVLMI
jgi:hypothetical protein